MVGRFEDLRLKAFPRGQNLFFHGPADIPGQEDCRRPVCQPKDEGRIVVRPTGLGWGGRGDRIDFHASDCPPEAAGDPETRRRIQGFLKRKILRVPRIRRSLPEFSNPEIPGDGREPVQVVGMGDGSRRGCRFF